MMLTAFGLVGGAFALLGALWFVFVLCVLCLFSDTLGAILREDFRIFGRIYYDFSPTKSIRIKSKIQKSKRINNERAKLLLIYHC